MNRFRTTLLLAFVLAVSPALAREEPPRSEAYRAGQRALERQDWVEASRIYARLAADSSDEVDAALYWKAYADWKRKRKQESLEGLRHLLVSYPESAWTDDARVLELEIRDGSGQDTRAADDEELKLYALDALMQVEPEKAVPVLERLLARNSSPRIRDRVLFVLAQSDSPRAREILLRTAKSGQPLELRRQAITNLAVAGDPDDLAVLAEIARDTSTPAEVRIAVVDAYLIANRPDKLVHIATSDPDEEIRAKAINALGAIRALPSLRRLWTTQSDPALRAKLLEAFGVAGDVGTLTKAARESSDPETRHKAIQGLGICGGSAASQTLRELYGELPRSDDKRKVLEALMVHGDGKVLIELFRAESDPSLKRAIFQQLSVMNDPETTRLILQLLGD